MILKLLFYIQYSPAIIIKKAFFKSQNYIIKKKNLDGIKHFKFIMVYTLYEI
jgi:hypothetical protein